MAVVSNRYPLEENELLKRMRENVRKLQATGGSVTPLSRTLYGPQSETSTAPTTSPLSTPKTLYPGAGIQSETATAPKRMGPAGDPRPQAPPPVAAPVEVAKPPAPVVAAPPATPPQLSPRAQSLLDQIEARLKAPAITGQQIMQSPEYQSQASSIDFSRQKAQSALRRSLASRNMLRSTSANQSLTESDAEYTAREQALVPQMVDTASRRQQQELQNLRNIFGDVTALDQQLYGRGVTDAGLTGRYNGQYTTSGRTSEAGLTGIDPVTGQPTTAEQNRQEALRVAARNEQLAGEQRERENYKAVTGRDLPPETKRLINELLALKEGSRGIPNANNAERMARAEEINRQLDSQGVDISKFGPDVTPEQARINASQIGAPQAVPLSEKEQLANTKAVLDLQMLQLDLELKELKLAKESAPNPTAEAEADLAIRQKEAELRKTEAEIVRINAEANKANRPAEPKPTTASTAQSVSQRWNVSNFGLTTNYAAFDKVLSDISAQSLIGGVTYDDVEEYVSENRREFSSNGVDANAILAWAKENVRPTFKTGGPEQPPKSLDDYLLKPKR